MVDSPSISNIFQDMYCRLRKINTEDQRLTEMKLKDVLKGHTFSVIFRSQEVRQQLLLLKPCSTTVLLLVDSHMRGAAPFTLKPR